MAFMKEKNGFKTRFISERIKHINIKPNVPDYYNIIKLNDTFFTLTGWLYGTSSDISYVLEEITKERIEENKHLASDLLKFKLL